MQTAFTQEQLARPEIADAAMILGDCVHYGFCTSVCPTYVLLRDENDAPRGRIDLIKAMLETDGPPDARTVGYIDRCLSCNSCMTTCAARVDYMHLADIARAHIERTFKRPLGDRLLRWLIATFVPHRDRFRLAMRLASLSRPFAGLLPGRLKGLIAMASWDLPARDAETRPGVYPAEGARKARVGLLTGCVQEALAPRLNAAAIRVLTRHGCEVVVADGARCCGAFTLHLGKEDRAKASAREAIGAFAARIDGDGLDAILVTASGCGTTMKDYGRIFAHGPEAERAAAISALTRDITEWLDRMDLSFSEETPGLAVAYHDACSLQHAQKVVLPPRQLLREAGFDVRDVPEKHFCCGSAGAYNMLQPAIAKELGERKAGHIESTGADLIAAGNLGCITQIGFYTDRPIVHTVELLDWATGGPMPPPLEGIEMPPPRAKAEDKPAEPGGGAAIW